ncbi:MAG: DUF1361 domain-containing protein [Anaerolineales bacterium]|nr:DUF1361 domain-containing protein [Anaerolineales bacterium]
MIRKIYENLKPFRFRLAIFTILSGASLLSVILVRLRIEMSGTADYAILVWNLFLAWLPLLISYAASGFVSRRRFTAIIVLPAAALWLLFFPNAPYILTDLIHLRHPREHVPVWFDTLLINWFAWTGMLLGVYSLFLMQTLVRRAFGRIAGWIFVLIVGTLCGVGTYIGRFLRWNSWDVVFDPVARLGELLTYAMNPSLQSIMFISIFSSLFIFIYVATYSFGLLLHEQQEPK